MRDKLEKLVEHMGECVVLSELGVGSSKKAYLIVAGDITRRVLKIATNQTHNSVQHTINTQRGHRITSEKLLLDAIDHPHIAKIVYADDTMSVEEYVGGMSLDKVIAMNGPMLHHKMFASFFLQLHSAITTIHDKGILHRDIKPANVLVGSFDKKATLIDFQYAENMALIQDKKMPTRGATRYAHPHLINSLVLGTPSCASIQSDIYAFGATMYYALTGKDAFSYSVIPKQSLNNQGLTLLCDNYEISHVDEQQHMSKLNQALDVVPEDFHAVLRLCLSIDSTNHSRINRALQNISNKKYEISIPKISVGDGPLMTFDGRSFVYDSGLGTRLTEVSHIIQALGDFRILESHDYFGATLGEKWHYSGESKRSEEYVYTGENTLVIQNNYWHDIQSSQLNEVGGAYWTERHDQTLTIDDNCFHRKLYFRGFDGVKCNVGCGRWERR